MAWALWHAPLLLSGLLVGLSFTVLLASLSIAFSWLWFRTGGNTGGIALAHGVVNAPFFFLEQLARPMDDGPALAARAFAYFSALYGIVAVALAVNGRHMWPVKGAWRGVRATEAPISAA